MICPKCGKQATVANVYDRDTDSTRRRYVCDSCLVVIHTEENIVTFGKLQPRPPRVLASKNG
jgi:transcriptional regulator NrdR family protein